MSFRLAIGARWSLAVSTAIGGFCAIILAMTSCGTSEKSPPASDPNDKLISVTGTISDWGGQNNPFKDYVFMLLDAEDGRAHRTLVGEGGKLTVTSVPANHKYYGVMLNTDFQFGWMVQFPATVDNVNRIFQVFSFNGTGSLGSLFAAGRLLQASQTDSLVPVKDFVYTDSDHNGIPDGLQADQANNENAAKKGLKDGDLDGDKILDSKDTDLDNDGIPDVFDSDIDNNGVDDLFDNDLNHDDVADELKDFRSVSDLGIGYRQVFHEIATNDDDTQSINLWFILQSKIKLKSVTVAYGSFLNDSKYVNGDLFDGNLFDNGSNGDGLEKDGIWTANVTLAKGKTFTSREVVIFKVVTTDGGTYEFPYKLSSMLTGTLKMTECKKVDTNLSLSWTVDSALSKYPNLSLQTLVSDDAGKRVTSSVRLPITATNDLIPISNFPTGKKYSCTVRVLAPSPVPGYPGSALRAKAMTYSN